MMMVGTNRSRRRTAKMSMTIVDPRIAEAEKEREFWERCVIACLSQGVDAETSIDGANKCCEAWRKRFKVYPMGNKGVA